MTPDLSSYDWILVNSSAGKDSEAALHMLVAEADRQSFPRDRIVVVHANLGRCEWKGVEALARRQAERYGLRFEVTQRFNGESILEYAQRRGMWPSSGSRWCTSEFKRTPCGRVVTALDRELRSVTRQAQVNVLNVFGFRREESRARAKYPSFAARTLGSTKSRTVDTWNPIIDWREEHVWTLISNEGLEYHSAYDLGMPRLSCVFCIFAPEHALKIAGRANPELLDEYAAVEAEIGHTFKADFAIGDVAAALKKERDPKPPTNTTDGGTKLTPTGKYPIKTSKGMVDCNPIDVETMRAKQAAGHPIVVSYGAGLDSTAVLCGLFENGVRPDAILFADTGFEKDATYRYLATMQTWCKSVGFPSITVVSYQTTEASRTDPRTGQAYTDLPSQAYATGHLWSFCYGGGNQSNATCSIKYKQQPQEDWARRWDVAHRAWDAGLTITKVIGYDCAEMHRGHKCRSHEPHIFDWCYPLRTWGWARQDLEDVVTRNGLPVPMKSSCVGCPAMKADEVTWLANNEPHNLLKVIEIEDRCCRSEHGKVTGGKHEPGIWMHKGNEKDEHGARYGSWRRYCEDKGLLSIAEQTIIEEVA